MDCCFSYYHDLSFYAISGTWITIFLLGGFQMHSINTHSWKKCGFSYFLLSLNFSLYKSLVGATIPNLTWTHSCNSGYEDAGISKATSSSQVSTPKAPTRWLKLQIRSSYFSTHWHCLSFFFQYVCKALISVPLPFVKLLRTYIQFFFYMYIY